MSKIYNADNRFFNEAIKLAHFGEHRVRVGALAVWKGTPVAGAFNTLRNVSPGVDYTDLTHHAETNALFAVSSRIRKSCVLYVARIGMKHDLLPSNPCPRCWGEIIHQNIKGVVYMDENLELVKSAVT